MWVKHRAGGLGVWYSVLLLPMAGKRYLLSFLLSSGVSLGQ